MRTKLSLFALLISCAIYAQPAFRQISNVNLSFNPDEFNYAHTDDFKFFLSSSKSDMAMIDGVAGKVLWTLNFSKDLNMKKFKNQFWNKEANVILLYDEDSKKGIADKIFVDGNSGKILWKSNEYVDEFGKYELSDGFSNYYDESTQCVLLPTKTTVDFVEVYTGKVKWSKSFELEGKARHFDCYIMAYYNLVKIQTGEETSIYLTTSEGKEVEDIDLYYNKKKALTEARRATFLEIPERKQYVIMKGKDSKFLNTLGILTGVGGSYQAWKMTFSCYESNTDRLIWEKEHMIAQSYDWITNKPYVRMIYQGGKLFIEHEPNLQTKTGLSVLNIETGELDWEAYYTTTEMKGLATVTLTPFPAPDPVVYQGKVYVVDKVNNRVCCYDLNNGTKLWQSDKFPDAQKIPNLSAKDGKIILTHGSPAKKIKKSEAESDYCFGYSTPTRRVICQGKKIVTYQYIFNNKDKYGIIAYDANTGKEIWSNETIAKKAKDKFAYIASTRLVNENLYCATDKNFFILNPIDGSVINSLPVSKEKLGKIWGMEYFEDKGFIILNCEKGIIKIDAREARIAGSLKTPNVPGARISELIGADDSWDDYAIYTAGKPEKMKYKQFASIDLNQMKMRGTDEAWILEADVNHFSEGAELFYKAKGKQLSVYSVK